MNGLFASSRYLGPLQIIAGTLATAAALSLEAQPSTPIPSVTYTRGKDLSGSLEGGVGGIGGLLARTDNRLLAIGDGGANAFYHADGNGNVTALVSPSQQLVAKYEYDPFGKTILSSGTLASGNAYQFSSKELHANSGTYYYGRRFYHPSLGRWLNQDPTGLRGGRNAHVFVMNQPTDIYDAHGLAPADSRDEWCANACETAKAENLDRNLLGGPKDAGGVICCAGKKTACVWDPSLNGKVTNPTAQEIVGACIKKHEESHFPEINCPQPSCGISREPWKDPKKSAESECAAWTQELKCLSDGASKCARSPECLASLDRALNYVITHKDQACGNK